MNFESSSRLHCSNDLDTLRFVSNFVDIDYEYLKPSPFSRLIFHSCPIVLIFSFFCNCIAEGLNSRTIQLHCNVGNVFALEENKEERKAEEGSRRERSLKHYLITAQTCSLRKHKDGCFEVELTCHFNYRDEMDLRAARPKLSKLLKTAAEPSAARPLYTMQFCTL